MIKNILKTALTLSFIMTFSPDIQAQENPLCTNTVYGTWNSGGGNNVFITQCADNTPCGTISYLTDASLIDANNPNAELRRRSLLGVQILTGFKPSSKGWKSGKIYNPENGKTYGSKLQLNADGTLNVKGCIGPFCESQNMDQKT